MNRIEFYNKLNKAKEQVRNKQIEHSSTQNNHNSQYIKVDDYYGINKPRYFTEDEFYELQHSGEYGKQHYNKIPNYYPDGRARYFWTKEEWDAYQREQEGKKIDEYRKQQAKKEEQNKMYDSFAARRSTTQDDLEKSFKKNMDAEKAMKNAEKQKWEKLRRENNPINTNKNNTFKTTQDVLKEEEYKKYKESTILSSKKVIDKYDDELTKLKGQLNLITNRNFSQEGDKKRYKQLEQQISEKERQIKKAKETLEKERAENAEKILNRRDNTIKDNISREQNRIKEEEKKKQEEAIREQEEKLDNWKAKSREEVAYEVNSIRESINKCFTDRDEKFTANNEVAEILKQKIAEKDSKFESQFDGDLAKYVRPEWYQGLLPFGYDEEHYTIVNDVLKEVENELGNIINNSTYEDVQYNSYFDKLQSNKKMKVNAAINSELGKARLSLLKIKNGDSKRFDLDPSLKKVLDKKMNEKYDDYASYDGNIYKYVRPYLFGKFIEDTDSYDAVLDILDDIERELKAEAKNPTYADFMSKVDKYF